MTVYKLDKFPLKVILCFLVFTEILTFIGPIDFYIPNKILLISYLFILNFSFYKGYQWGLRTFKPSKYDLSRNTIYLFLILGFIGSVTGLYLAWSAKGLSISFSTLIYALSNPGDTYNSDGEILNLPTFFVIFSIFKYSLLPITFYTWNRLPSFYKVLALLGISFQLVTWLGIGTRKGIFDILFVAFFLYILNIKNLWYNSKYKKRKICVCVSTIIIFLSYFIFSNLSRGNSTLGDVTDEFLRMPIRDIYLDVMPIGIIYILYSITFYLSHGYYALSFALSEYGIITPKILSTDWFSIAQVNKFGYDALSGSYIDLLQAQGVDMTNHWHSAYVWFANEFTFIFVPFVIFIIAYFLAKTWKDSLYGRNILSSISFSSFIIMSFYLFANTNFLSSSFIPFVFWLFLYLISWARV